MALARHLAQYDSEQRKKQHQSILRQQHIRNGQILHALEQNLAAVEAKAREFRTKGIHDKELDVLLTEARWKRDQARTAALAGMEHGHNPNHVQQPQQPQQPPQSQSPQSQPQQQHLPSSNSTSIAPIIPPPPLTAHRNHPERMQARQLEPTREPTPEPQRPQVVFSTSPEPLSTSPPHPTESTEEEIQPAPSTLASLFRAGLSRLPASPFTPVVDSFDLSSPPRAASPLRTVAGAARRLSVPLALPRRSIIHTSPAQPSPQSLHASQPLRQPHPRRKNERLAILCQRDCWKVRHRSSIHLSSLCYIRLPHPSCALPRPSHLLLRSQSTETT